MLKDSLLIVEKISLAHEVALSDRGFKPKGLIGEDLFSPVSAVKDSRLTRPFDLWHHRLALFNLSDLITRKKDLSFGISPVP